MFLYNGIEKIIYYRRKMVTTYRGNGGRKTKIPLHKYTYSHKGKMKMQRKNDLVQRKIAFTNRENGRRGKNVHIYAQLEKGTQEGNDFCKY